MRTETKVILGIVFVTIVILVGAVFLLSSQGQKEQEKLSKPLLGDEIVEGAQHVSRGQEHGAYKSNPSTSGPHWADGTAGPGIKDTQGPDELLVHSMEHGAVVVYYKDDLPQADKDRIRAAYDKGSGKKILTPRKELDVPVAMTSWGRLLKLQTIDDAKITEFIDTNNDRAPEKAPI